MFSSVLSSMWYSLRLAFAGFVVGVTVGMLLAIAMIGVRLVRRALLPWVVVSQTVPLIALAPLVYGWGGQSDAVRDGLAAVDVRVGHRGVPGLLPGRGRRAARAGLPTPTQNELLTSFAASWWQTLLRLRLPASVPYLVPSLKLAAAAAVIGAIVAEISTGLQGGIGRLIISYAQQATGDPARVYAPSSAPRSWAWSPWASCPSSTRPAALPPTEVSS